jgi:diaminohydroxyphosphoribosylaminopyrimidine deaminase / 5-amino-6-(5-phosphoribosylamino)uracil reductase
MHYLPEDEHHLQRALELARNAVGLASPNPTVGCVLARDEKVLGEGAHLYDNRDHAEISALKDATARNHDVHGATAYVTLEPCSHHGRTGPCADALIAAGIARCVVATVDPNPQVRGSGIAKLRNAGIEVQIVDTALTQQARDLDDAFAWTIQHGRPFITLKAALSVDGKLAPPPHQRRSTEPFWLTGEAARADVQQLRHASDAILTGIGTILADDPLLSDRTGLPRRRPLLRIVLDSQLRTPLDSRLVNSAADDVLLLCHETAAPDRIDSLRKRGVEVVAFPGKAGRLDLTAALATLSDRKLLSILVEAGTATNGSFLAAGLVDKLVLYYSETELGNDALPFAEGIASPYILQQRLQRLERHTFSHGTTEDVRISGYLHDPWTGIDSADSPTR